MSPIGKFRKPEWEHRDPARRREAVAESRDPALGRLLPTIAREDEDAGVRLAAVERLDDLGVLLAVADSDADAAVRALARERAVERLGRLHEPDTESLERGLSLATPDERLALLRDAADVRIREQLLASVEDPALLAERALKESAPALARVALERLSDPDQLERVARAMHRRDKKLHRLASEKLEELRFRAGDPEAVRARAERLVEELESMVRSGETSGTRRREIEAQWRDLPPDGKQALKARFDGARRILERASNPPPPPEPAPAPEPETGHATVSAEKPAADIELPRLEELAAEAELLAGQPAPSEADSAELERRWQRHWSSAADENPEAAELQRRFRAALDRARHTRENRDRRDREWREKIDGLLATLEQELESGDLHQARESDHELKALIHDGEHHLPKSHQRRLAAAHRRLHELRDWQHWANNRVRTRLCEEVEALPESDLHPDAVLEALKRAQKSWRELEDSEKLSGEKHAYRASGPGLWRRFQAAGKRAFDHAKPFLEKRSQIREHKLEATRALVDELQSLEQADEIGDPRAVAKLLSRARRALKRLDELPPPERGPMARQLRHGLDALGKRLDHQRDALAADKRALIEEAANLDADDVQGAVNNAKSIMARWKRLDTLPRGRERKLWQELRGHLDPVFERRDEQMAEARQEREQEQATLQSLVGEVERLAALPGPELAESATELNRLRGEWQSHRNRPRELEQRFRDAVDGFRHRLAEQRAAEHFERIRAAFRKARICRRVECGELSPADAESEWSGLPELAAGLDAELRQRLEHADRSGADAGEALERAERCVLCMELLSGVESPPEAEEARMQLKIERLNDAMRGGRRDQDPESEMERLLKEWALSGKLPAEQAEALEARAARALEAFHGKPFD